MNYISRKIGLCICAVQLIASAVFFVALWLMNLLPAKYVTIIGLVLLLFFVCVVSTQLLSKKKGIAGKVISILLSIGLIFGSYYIFKHRITSFQKLIHKSIRLFYFSYFRRNSSSTCLLKTCAIFKAISNEGL